MSGAEVFALGWAGPVMLQFGWFANFVLPLLLLTTPFAGESRIVRTGSVWLAGLLLLLTLNAAMWSEIPTDFMPIRVVRFRIGYWLWMEAMLGAVALALISAFLARREVALSAPG